MKRAVFLDRDGVLNLPVIRKGKPYPPETLNDFRLYPDAVEACACLKKAGFLLVLVTNQPDVGRGTQTIEVIEQMHALLNQKITLDRIEICTAANDQAPDARRRKPAPGMLLDAAHHLQIDLTSSFLIGDRWRDIDAGHAAGCKTVLLQRGYDESLRKLPDYECSNLRDAVSWIL